ncbi:unnamed protein product (mitochondrion) [Plasmodiophora brassicae]|uniref:Uncharacterized protein n=1 Tax=Plasmodiophora brassicae TaxID=37360 RepID=A0A3P3YJ64_PLABS|nr:unnamed protein product [Plasmodiophora brassicae]
MSSFLRTGSHALASPGKPPLIGSSASALTSPTPPTPPPTTTSAVSRTPGRSRRPTGSGAAAAALDRNEFRVVEVVAPCPSIVRQTIRSAPSIASVSARLHPSGYAVVVSPTRLVVWNACRPDEPAHAITLDDASGGGDDDAREPAAADRVALIYDRPVEQRTCTGLLYARAHGHVVFVGDLQGAGTAAARHLRLDLHDSETVTVVEMVNARLFLLGTSQNRLVQVDVGRESGGALDAHVVVVAGGGDGHRRASMLTRVVTALAPLSSSSSSSSSSDLLPYLSLCSPAPLTALALTPTTISEVAASETGAWSVAWSTSAPVDDMALAPNLSACHLVDLACVRHRVVVLTAARYGPLNRTRYAVALYDRRAGAGLVPVHRACPIDAFDTDDDDGSSGGNDDDDGQTHGWGGRAARVDLSDQDPALAFVYGRRSVAIVDLSTGASDCVRFDDGLLGGGRCRDHRGCFFVSAAHGVVCVRLARGPPTTAILHERPGAALGLPSAFTAFQQARIANCRALLAPLLTSASLADDVERLSTAIVDGGDTPLADRQARHAAFCEFLRSMPSSPGAATADNDDGNIWARLPPGTRSTLRAHADALDLALATQAIVGAPAAQFPEVVPGARPRFDAVRRRVLRRALRAAGLPAPDTARVEDMFFARVSQFTDVLPGLVDALGDAPDDQDVALQVVFVCRVVRVVFSVADENADQQAAPDPTSWMFTGRVRAALRTLLTHLARLPASTGGADAVQPGFVASAYFHVASILCGTYLSESGANPCAAGADLDAVYKRDRDQAGQTLLSLCAAEGVAAAADGGDGRPASPTARFELAFAFGERFADLSLLAQLCARCARADRADAYLREHGRPYGLATLAVLLQARRYDDVMRWAAVHPDWVGDVLADHPLLAWVPDLDRGDYAPASAALKRVADDDHVALRLRRACNALSKLAYLTSARDDDKDDDDDAELADLNAQRAVLDAQGVLRAGDSVVVSGSERIRRLIGQGRAASPADVADASLVAAARLIRMTGDGDVADLLDAVVGVDGDTVASLAAPLRFATGTTEQAVEQVGAGRCLTGRVLRELAQGLDDRGADALLDVVARFVDTLPGEPSAADLGPVLNALARYAVAEGRRRRRPAPAP